MTGHTDGVRVIFDPGQVTFDELLQVFWESRDPTQGMRQGNDVGKNPSGYCGIGGCGVPNVRPVT